jgi:hypothetical protein
MHRAWRGRAAGAALAMTVCGLLVGCNPTPGQATLTVTGAVEVEDPPGAVTCQKPGDGGETYVPTWEWRGTIDGEAASFLVSSQTAYLPNEGALTVGTLLPGSPGEIVTERVDDDGTLHVRAHLEPWPAQGGDAVDIVAKVRCPGWGHSTMTGSVTGALGGTTGCTVPSGSDAYSYAEIRASNLDGQLRGGTLSFAGLSGPAIDTALLSHARVTWGATNQPGQPPEIETSIDGEGVLTAGATFRRLDGQPGTVEVDAVIRCP